MRTMTPKTRAFVEDAVEQARAFLSAQPGVRKVWLFGSAAKGRELDFRSDLDFAVEGLDWESHFSVWNDLEWQLHFPVDLQRWEQLSEALRENILATGRVIYEA